MLYGHQSKAISKLNKFKVGALFMEPGTGKTRTAYNLAKSIKNLDYILWLAPYSTINSPNYKNSLPFELEKCGGLWKENDLKGIESFSNSDRIYLETLQKIKRYKNPLIVLDESLKIKNWYAKRTKRILEISKHAEFKLILNGTPLSKNLLDLWAQMEFLSPRILNMNIVEYKNNYCEYTTITKKVNGYTIKKEFISDFHNIDHLYSLIEPYVYECDLKLGVEKKYKTIYYDLNSIEIDTYNNLKEHFLSYEHLIEMNNNIFLSMLQKMQHSYSCAKDKFLELDSLFKNLFSESETIIFCKYISSAKACTKRYPKALILTYGKHSYGLNLQNRNNTIFFDKTFDYAQRLQAENRTYRSGQKKDCQFWDLNTSVGLDKLIDSNIIKKESILENFRKVGLKKIKKIL